MSQVAVASKAAKSTAAPSEAKAESLREVLPKRFSPSDFYPTGQDYEILHVTPAPDWTFDDVMNPTAWAHVCKRVSRDALQHRKEKIGSTVYVHSKNFFAILNIDSVVYDKMDNPCGLNVTCIGPGTDPETLEQRPVEHRDGKAFVIRSPKSAKAA